MRTSSKNYLIAISTVLLAASVQSMFVSGPSLILFVPAVTFSAWLGGLGPGLLCTFLSTAICSYFYIPPIGSFRIQSAADGLQVLVFCLQGVMTSALMERLRAAVARAENDRNLHRPSEGLLGNLVDSAPATIYIKDRAGRYLMVNRRYQESFGGEPRPLVGCTDFDLFPPEVAEKLRSDDGRVLATGRALETRDVVPREDGPRTYWTIKFPLRDRDGSHYAVAGFSLDATERRRAEDVNAVLASVVDSSDDAILSKNLDGVITSWNAAAERLFGYTAEEALGQHVALIIPEDRQAEETEILDKLRRGIRVEHFETVRRRRDGTLVDISLTVSPVRNAAGRVIGASKIARDISERKRTDEVLRRQAILLDQVFDPVLAWASGSSITYWNQGAERLYGFTAAEALGHKSHTLLQTIFPDGPKACEEALRDHGHWEGELRHRTKAGAWVVVDSRMTVVSQPGGMSWVLESNRDVTDRKRAEKALRRSSERLEALSRKLLHAQEEERRRIARELHDEIGQALTALKINLQSVLGGAEPATERLLESVGIVDQALRQVRGMALDLRPSVLDDLGLVAALDWYVGRHAQRTGLQGRFMADPDDLRADPEVETACFRLAQEALTNIARHARATGFSVELLQHAGGLQLVVRDNGTGFDPEAALRDVSRGRSVGLAAMQERVELLGGRIAFLSGPERGTEVQAEFPGNPRAPAADTEPDDTGGQE